MSDDTCPVQVPRLLAVKSVVVRCGCCGAWIERFPAYLDGDEYEDCPRDCGCTSVRVTEGRPYGPRSKQWEAIVSQFNSLWELVPETLKHEDDNVLTDPRLEAIDWNAIAAWNARRGVYPIHIKLEWVGTDDGV